MVSPRFCNYDLLPHLATVRLCIASYSLHIRVCLATIQGNSLPEPLLDVETGQGRLKPWGSMCKHPVITLIHTTVVHCVHPNRTR